MSGYGPIHKLTVHEIGELDEPFELNEFEDYDLEHPAECKYEDGEYRCGVQWNLDSGGLRWTLKYSGTPVTEPGEYQIQAWAETYRGFDYTEYDGGIGLYVPDGN
jgi:hypothetical protein